jgi:hypothetical protein
MPRIATPVRAVLPDGYTTTFNRRIEHGSYQEMRRKLDRLLHRHTVVFVMQVISPGPRTLTMDLGDPTKNTLDGVQIEDPNEAYRHLQNGQTLNVACSAKR